MKKYILTLFLIFALSSRADENDFELDGVQYTSNLTADDTKGTPGWKPGSGEPNILPNKAYKLAKKKFDEEFRKNFPNTTTYFISLRYVSDGKEGIAFWEVVFTEDLSPADFDTRPRKKSADGGEIISIANPKYFVFMDGKVIGPRPKKYFEDWVKAQK
jgi:hypothetical protein